MRGRVDPEPENCDFRPSAKKYSYTQGEHKRAAIRKVVKHSEIIGDEGALNSKWEALLEERRNGYLHIFRPINFKQNRIIKNGLASFGIDLLMIRKKQYAKILDHLRCEAHAKASKDVIDKYLR